MPAKRSVEDATDDTIVHRHSENSAAVLALDRAFTASQANELFGLDMPKFPVGSRFSKAHFQRLTAVRAKRSICHCGLLPDGVDGSCSNQRHDALYEL